MKNRLMGAAAAAAFSVSSFFGSIAHAANIDLAFIMDSSGSVGSSNFNSAMNSLGDALASSIPVGGTDTYRIGVVTFASGAALTSFETIDSQAKLNKVVNDVKNQSYVGGLTNYQAAFNLTVSTFGALGDASIVNMMTDGNSNLGNTANGLAGLKGAGFQSLSFESIGNGADNTFLAGLGFDTGGDGATILTDANQITDPLNDAFVLEVSGFGDAYDQAIKTKVQRIVTPGVVPLPTALPLLGGGILIMGFVGRRRKAAAA